MSSSFARKCTVTAATKRSPSLTAGKRGEPVPHLASLRCTPLDPTDQQARDDVYRRRPQLQSSASLLETFTAETDFREGDLLIVNGQEYPIRIVNVWEWRGATFRHLIVEELQR